MKQGLYLARMATILITVTHMATIHAVSELATTLVPAEQIGHMRRLLCLVH